MARLPVIGGSDSKASAYNAGDPGSIPGSGRSPGEGNGNPLQYSCLETPMDGGAWWAIVHGVAKSQIRLSDFTFFSFFLICVYICFFPAENIQSPTALSSVQLLSRARLLATPWTAAHQGSLSITNSQNPPKPMSIESVMPSNHLILCCPLLLPPSIFPSIRVFPMSQFFISGGQSIEVSASTSVLPMNTQD